MPEILHAIVGTAGHVDHGKTELVKQLTGHETDRLPEEKARGMSIDLGFAPWALSDGRLAGVVDVPGHQDFIRNMVAGAASIDVLLLVVAADDGIMPQTDEHMRIVKLLRTPRVMAVVTKIDLVPTEIRQRVRQDVLRFLHQNGYADAAVVLASNRTGEGLDAVKRALENRVNEATVSKGFMPPGCAFRMNIERAFTVKGHGTIATGIPLAGEVGLEGKLELLPGGQVTGVRAIQTFRHDASRATASACCALNVRDLGADFIRRGMTLAEPGVFVATQAVIGTLENASRTIVIRQREKVRLHAGTSVTTASLGLIGADQLGPGEQAFVHAKLDDPVVLVPGDRFIIRCMTPPSTLGGGSILTTCVARVRRKSPTLRASLEEARQAVARGEPFGAALAAGSDAILDRAELFRLTQCTPEAAQELVATEQAKQNIIRLGDRWLVSARIGELAARVELTLQSYHRSHPYAWGMTPRHLCKLLSVGPHDVVRLIEELTRSHSGVALRHGCLALVGHRPLLSEQQLASKDEIARRVEAAGINPPARGDLQAALSLASGEMNLLTRLLAEEGKLTLLRRHLLWRQDFERCREGVIGLFSERQVVNVNAFRAASGMSRRVAVEVLEIFDAEGLTRRVENGRVLVKFSG
jgi:selenocysteine-specific elongation factor